MKFTLFAFSFLLVHVIQAGTWENPAIGKHSIRFVARDNNVNYPTVIVEKHEDFLRVRLIDKDGNEVLLSGTMTKLAELNKNVKAVEPRMQDFVGLVREHLQNS